MDFAANASLQLEEGHRDGSGRLRRNPCRREHVHLPGLQYHGRERVAVPVERQPAGRDASVSTATSTSCSVLADVTSGFTFVFLETDGPAIRPPRPSPATRFSRSDAPIASACRRSSRRCARRLRSRSPAVSGRCRSGADLRARRLRRLQSAGANLDFTFTPVPEPARVWLLAAGVAALGILRRHAPNSSPSPAPFLAEPFAHALRRMIDWNATRFDPVSPLGHVESHFLKLNDASGERALWLKATILRRLGQRPWPRRGRSLRPRAGHTAAKQVVPWASASFSRDALAIRVAEVEIGPMRTRGALAAKDARIEWDLAFTGGAAPFVPPPEAALPRRRGQLEDREPASRPALRRALPRRRSARGRGRLARDAGPQLGPPPHPPLRLAALQRLGGCRRPGRGRDHARA